MLWQHVSREWVERIAPGVEYSSLVLSISKRVLSRTIGKGCHYVNWLVPNARLPGPLLATASFLSERLTLASAAEIKTLVEGFLALLPLAVDVSRTHNISPKVRENISLEGICAYVRANIDARIISPQTAADHLEISTRYVHKLFSLQGTTFGAFVTMRRLERVCRDMTTMSLKQTPIAELAYRRGFKDLSTFNRAFKKHYGCTPSAYRKSHQTLVR